MAFSEVFSTYLERLKVKDFGGARGPWFNIYVFGIALNCTGCLCRNLE